MVRWQKKNVKMKPEDGGKSLKDAGDKIKSIKKAFDDAINKAEEPFKILKAKQQQAKNTMEEVEKKKLKQQRRYSMQRRSCIKRAMLSES